MNLFNVMENLSRSELVIEAKKKKLVRSKVINSYRVPLGALASNFVMFHNFQMCGVPLKVQINIFKSTKVPEFTDVPTQRKEIGPILPPFK